MNDILAHLQCLQCSDCKSELKFKGDDITCSKCGRIYKQINNIWHFLPSSIDNWEGKEKEKQGWTTKAERDKQAGWEPPPEHYLSLPDHPHPYYQAASWYLKIVMAYGGPWTGKKVLELGAAECWATRKFAEAGADAIATDYDPTRMLKGQILLDHLPIRFLRMTADAECLPFTSNCFDAVFCCSVLHHFFNFDKAVKEIGRVLKPGGMFLGIHEAFHPPYYSKEKILRMSQDTIPNIEAGINECSYTAARYRRSFQNAGLKFDLIHPRWDVKIENSSIIVKPNINILDTPGYIPLMFTARAGLPNLMGKIARLILSSGIWKIAANRLIFPLIRFQILNWSTKEKIIIARKVR